MRNGGIGSWPARRARACPQRPALVADGEVLTYAELDERVTRWAHALRALGVRPGDRVAYLGPNLPSLVETMFAAGVLGAVFVPLNSRLAAPEVAYQLEDCAASVLVVAPQSAGVVEALGLVGVRVVVVGRADPTTPAWADHSHERLLRDAVPGDGPAPRIDVPVTLDDPALVLYTSGTTGRPKGAVLTHGNVTWNCVDVLVDVDVTSQEVALVAAPLFHVAALGMLFLPTFLKGGCSVLMASWDVDTCLDLVERHRVTWMFGVPTMYASLAASPRWRDADLSSLRVLLGGGATVPLPLIRTFADRGLTLVQGFGLTETSPGALILGADAGPDKLGTAGVPHFFADVRVVRPDLTDVATGEPGEILVSGPTVTPGYWRRPDATAEAFSGEWFHSGDVGTVDEDGYVTVVDRVKDMYVSGGENVYPAEVEAVLAQHPAVAEVAVVGVPDDHWGEVGRAYVRLHDSEHSDSPATEADLLTYLHGRLARYKIPRSIRFVDSLPRTGSGKIRKAHLKNPDTDRH